jgi:hypothetical protein
MPAEGIVPLKLVVPPFPVPPVVPVPVPPRPVAPPFANLETIVGKRGVSTALGAIVEGSERGCASRRSARARGGADEEVLDDVGAFSASDDLLIAAA